MAFVTFEGIEGSGKSTQARRTAEWLGKTGREVCLEREPGGTAFGVRLREALLDPGLSPDSLTEVLIFIADRRQHVLERITPALARGAMVLCDRFRDATEAYQGGGRGIPADVLQSLERLAGDLRPDRTLLLDCPVETGLARARHRDAGDGARFEREPAEFHRRVREAYLAIARREPERVRVIDSTRTEQEVFDNVCAALEDLR
jgi:dTMP kinase